MLGCLVAGALCIACHICLVERGPGWVLYCRWRILLPGPLCFGLFDFSIFPLPLPLPSGSQSIRMWPPRLRAPCELCGDKFGQDGATCYPYCVAAPESETPAADAIARQRLTRWSYRRCTAHTQNARVRPKKAEKTAKQLSQKNLRRHSRGSDNRSGSPSTWYHTLQNMELPKLLGTWPA